MERQIRKENMRKLREAFQNDPSINSKKILILDFDNFYLVSTPWRKVKEQYENNELFKQLEKNDRLTVFSDYIR